jgi:dolichol-phosphate mannosyltransferase
MMKLSIVVPVYNEAENILPLLNEIKQALSSAKSYEVIYVDDGSQDDTAKVLQQAMCQFSTLRVFRHQTSYGQSAALRTGIKQATSPVIATLDGDGQNDPADIPRLYAALMEDRSSKPNLWMVAGWRQKRLDSKWRIFSSKFANAIRSTLLKDKTPDTGCGLKVFLRDKFLDLPYFDHMHRFLPALIIREGGQVISEPVNHRPRERGVSKYGTWGRLWVGIIDLIGVMWLLSRAQPVIAEEINNG